MKKMEDKTDKIIHALLSGRHPLVKKYAGKQVFVIHDEIVPLKEGSKGLKDFHQLKEKYKEPPTLIFVPKPGATYILFLR